MPVTRLEVEGYRSLRRLRLALGPVTVLVGANGCGKSNLYRALRLLHAAAAGRLAEGFAEEGGMPSALWAGEAKRRDEIRSVRLAVAVDIDRFRYRLACGLPLPGAIFPLDPEVKEEDVGVRVPGRQTPVPLCERRALVATVTDDEGRRETYPDPLDPSESVLVQIADPKRFPELALVRQLLSGWRFYHAFRTDPESPLRLPRLGSRAPALAHDGANLAAALVTLRALRDDDALERAIDAAFPGCALVIDGDERGGLAVGLRQPGISRALGARELSDGTLRFLCLAAALLTPRPPALLVLNEPETSLHADLLPPLAGLVAEAATRCQVLVTTHARVLADAIAARTGAAPVELALERGETVVVGQERLRHS